MRLLYQYWLSPFSRKVRIALKEKGLDFEPAVEKYWERRPDFMALNPAGQVPVLIEPDGYVLADSQAICEYLEEAYGEVPLIGDGPLGRAETRRLIGWFDQKFHREATQLILREKLLKRFMGMGQLIKRRDSARPSGPSWAPRSLPPRVPTPNSASCVRRAPRTAA